MTEAAANVVAGCRVLGGEEAGDPVWGHVSVRDPDGRGAWIKAGARGFSEVASEDVVLVSFDGELLAGTARVPREYPLHTEILRARDDVNSVVHTHSPHAIALAATGQELHAFSNAAGPFAGGVPRFTRAVGLIDTPELGSELATALGAARAAFMTGHGAVTAGSSVGVAVVTAVLLERACHLQLVVNGAGGLASDLADPGDRYAHTAADHYMLRTWEYLLRQVARD